MADPSPPTNTATDPELRRQEKIHRGWVGFRDRAPRAFWGAGTVWGNATSIAFLIALYLGALCLFPDLALWWPEANPDLRSAFHRVAGPGLALGLILLSILNGLLLDAALSDQTGDRRRLTRTAHALRVLFCSLPLVGLAVPPLWYARVDRLPEGLTREPAPFSPAPVGSPGVFQGRIVAFRRWLLSREWIFLWILLSHVILPVAWIFWLANPVEMTRFRQAAIVAVSVLGHLLAFACMGYYAIRTVRDEQMEGWRRLPLFVLPIFWLVPLPYFFVLGFFLLIPVPIHRLSETLVSTAHSRRGSVDALEVWKRMEGSLRSGWSRLPFKDRVRPPKGVESPVQPGVEQQRLSWLYKGKSAVLLFESVALALWLDAADPVLMAAGLGALAVGGVALVVHLVYVVLRWIRSSRLRVLDGHPYAFFVAVTQLLFFAGCFIGVSWRRGEEASIGGILLVLGMVGLLAEVAKMVLPIPERVRTVSAEPLLWVLLFFTMAVTGLSMHRGPEEMEQGLQQLILHARVHPLLSVLIGGLLVNWLLRPFRAPQIFDGELSWRRRMLLAGLTLTAVAPLGGLFVPWWIYVRHRVWPRLGVPG